MDQGTYQEIKTKTTSNILFLTFRNMGIQAVSTIGFFLLTLLLGTAEVGLFAIVAESISILGYFSDVGLASALIQQKDEVTKEELRTTFSIQQLLVFICLTIVVIIFPSISRANHFGAKETWILISLCFSFVAASLKTIPSVLLERKLDFKLISTIDIIENISFYVVAVFFAYLKFGAFSYAIATFVRSTLGLAIIYLISPWPVGISFSMNSAKKLFKYGIPFQLNTFIAMAKDRLSNLMVAGVIGSSGFGLLSWAQKLPRMPLSLMDAIMRVTFPTFSRLQEHTELLRNSIRRSLYFIAFFIFPALVGIASVSQNVVDFIPKYSKWSPAIFPLYMYSISFAIAAITTPLTNAFNAIGKITVTTKLMIMWTALTWIFYPLLSIRYGYVGTSYAALIVGSSSFVVWFVAGRIFQINILKSILHPLIGSLITLGLLVVITNTHISPGYQIISKIFVGVTSYSIYQFIFSKSELEWFLKHLKGIRS